MSKARFGGDNPVPIIDVGPALTGDEDGIRQVGRAVDRACRDIGFFYVVGHGIDWGRVRDAFTAARKFFHRPMSEKLACVSKTSDHRGYRPRPEGIHPTRVADPTIAAPVPDHRESYNVGPTVLPAFDADFANGPFGGANVWPAEPALFRPAMTALHDSLYGLSMTISRALASGMGLQSDAFAAWLTQPQTLLTANFYPTRRADALPGELGVAGHTDYGFLTVLAQDDVGGLEVLDRGEVWRSVAPISNAFVCNIGDLIERLTNGHYRATRHRVLSPPGRDRCSLAFFIDPDPNAIIGSADFCRVIGEPSKFPPIRCRDYLESIHYRGWKPAASHTKAHVPNA